MDSTAPGVAGSGALLKIETKSDGSEIKSVGLSENSRFYTMLVVSILILILVLLAPPAVTHKVPGNNSCFFQEARVENETSLGNSTSTFLAPTTAMATTPAAGETAAALYHGRAHGTRPPSAGFAFFPRSPSQWATISLPPAPRRAAPASAAAAAGERVAAAEEEEEEGPASVELEPISSEQQLDRALAEAQQLDLPIVLLWMASWCRKCIYLKPKLEKLAAEYYPRIRFYCVDVNAVPQKLVNRAGVTKMPSIQLWSDSQKQAEVIGGHKSWLVIDDVRRMIEREE